MNEFTAYLDYNVEQMVEHIRKCPKKYQEKLPEQLKKWLDNQITLKQQLKIGETIDSLSRASQTHPPDQDEIKIRRETAMYLLSQQPITGQNTPETMADYVVELTDALLQKLKA